MHPFVIHRVQGVCDCAQCGAGLDIGDVSLEWDGRLFCGRECFDKYHQQDDDEPDESGRFAHMTD